MNVRISSITGAEGAVKLGNQRAASLSSWSLTPRDGSWVFSGVLADRNTWLIAQRPESVVLQFGKQTIRFSAPLEIGGNTVTATLLVKPEVR